MDPLIVAVIALVLGLSIWRFGRTYRSVRSNKEEDFQKRLEQLRKKRDEQ